MTPEGIRRALEAVLEGMGAGDAEVRLERPRDPAHGDWASNVAMSLAGRLRRPPRQIAEEIASALLAELPEGIAAVEVAGPGFLNFRLSAGAVAGNLATVLELDERYGRSTAGGGRPIMVEFVSANPTGPLHLGHGRQAALGDGVSRLLEWTGWAVHREFYYNDAGRQIERLVQSVDARYRQLLGETVQVPEDGYQGEYVRDLATALVERDGDRWLTADPAEAAEAMRRFAVAALRDEQDADLSHFRLHFDHYFLESSLYESGRVDETARRLRATGLVYESEGATWLRTTEYGDQKDRVMIKSDGDPTYFLPDVAYHLDKWERGFEQAINVQGADHHGTVARVRAGLQALGLPAGYPEYLLHQMVRVERDGQEVKLSKRAGSYTTFREVIDTVGVDVTRWFFQMRKPEAHLVFDLDLALDTTEKNPVYKVQYAHARMCSIFGKAGEEVDGFAPDDADLTLLEHEIERELVQTLDEFPDQIERAAEARAPHLLTDYLERLAGEVNSWYHAGNPSRNPELAVLVDDPALRRARLVLAAAVRIVLRNGLSILGIDAPRRMERLDDISGDAAGPTEQEEAS